jgi:hypothetical protein
MCCATSTSGGTYGGGGAIGAVVPTHSGRYKKKENNIRNLKNEN